MSTELAATLEAKLAELDRRIASFGHVAVAFSGGVDSTALLHACVRVLGASRVIAVTADSESLPRAEREEALALARTIGARLHMVRTREIENPDYRRNDEQRCYFCKRELFETMEKIASELDIDVLAYGAIADDLLDRRPGARAAQEFRVAAPLQEAGLSKSEIREYSARHGLPTASKASFACLSSRVPAGTEVSAELLARIDSAENSLRRRGFTQYRVRHLGSLAKIEVGIEETPRLLSGEGEGISAELRELGYERVAVDLRGYRDPSQRSLVSIETPFWSESSVTEDDGLRWMAISRRKISGVIADRIRAGDVPANSLLWPLLAESIETDSQAVS